MTILVAAAAAATLTCTVQAGDDDATAFREDAQKDAIYLLAAGSLGAPKSCAQTFTESEGQHFRKITVTWKHATFTMETMPPETSVTELRLSKGTLDETKAMDALGAEAKAVDAKLDFTQSPKPKTEKDGSVRRTWWSPDEGDNIGADVFRKKDKIVGLSFHLAL